MSAQLPLLSAATLVLTLAYVLKRLRSKTHPPLPPGPPSEPFIGHLRVFPTENRELFFHELRKVYGAWSRAGARVLSWRIALVFVCATQENPKVVSLHNARPP
jgi:hypothetical protein